MTWLLLAVLVVGLPLLSWLEDLARRDLARTLSVAEAALRGEERS